jgi:hypothetical protein
MVGKGEGVDMSAHGPFGRVTFTEDQKTKIRKDKATMTYEELKAKWGSSYGNLQRICSQDRQSVLSDADELFG